MAGRVRQGVVVVGLKFPRRKQRRLWLSVLYRVHRWARFPARLRLAFYLNAHWVFGRFAHEESHRLLEEDEHPLHVGTQRFLARHLPSDAIVLDLGCGNGIISSWLAENSALVVGVDHNMTNLRRAMDRPKRSNLQFVHGDAREFLDGSDREFTVLVLSHVLEHLDHPEAFLSQFSADFSFVYIEVPDFEGSPHNLLRVQLGLELSYADADHITEFGRVELEDVVRDAGLRVVSVERIHGVQRLWCEAF